RPARAEPGVGAAGGEPHRGQAGRAAGRAGGRRRLAGRPLPQPAVEPPLGDGQVAGGWPVATKPRPRPFVLDPSQGALMPPVFTAARPADAETVPVLAVPVLAGRPRPRACPPPRGLPPPPPPPRPRRARPPRAAGRGPPRGGRGGGFPPGGWGRRSTQRRGGPAPPGGCPGAGRRPPASSGSS